MLDVMDELGIEPNATLHHFTHPIWFEDAGAFQKAENIEAFVEYAKVWKMGPNCVNCRCEKCPEGTHVLISDFWPSASVRSSTPSLGSG